MRPPIFALQCIKFESLKSEAAKNPLFQIWGKICMTSVYELMCQNIEMCQLTPLPPYMLHYVFPDSFKRIPGPAVLTVPLVVVVFHFSAVIARSLSCSLVRTHFCFQMHSWLGRKLLLSHCQVGSLIHSLQLFCFMKL